MNEKVNPEAMRDFLDCIYSRFNRREFVHPDPIEFLYNYEDIRDREIAAIVASSLAYGRVSQIINSVSSVLKRMGRSPLSFIMNSSKNAIAMEFSGFKHRFTDGAELSSFLLGLKSVIEEYGSLQSCFLKGLKDDDEDLIPALGSFIQKLERRGNFRSISLIPDPKKGGACKRLNLFLRWMVRRDDVDPGGWEYVPKSKLVIPLDTHMYRISILFGFTRRKRPDITTALEITSSLRKINPEDPVKYDFSLTRTGIRKDLNIGRCIDDLMEEKGNLLHKIRHI